MKKAPEPDINRQRLTVNKRRNCVNHRNEKGKTRRQPPEKQPGEAAG